MLVGHVVDEEQIANAAQGANADAFANASTITSPVLWNHGEPWRGQHVQFKRFIASTFGAGSWEQIAQMCASVFKCHVYRSEAGGAAIANRHGHSNDLPSYWALGFTTVEEMMAKVSREAADEYKEKHRNCCGFGVTVRKMKYDYRDDL
jgi:hypothetical protein